MNLPSRFAHESHRSPDRLPAPGRWLLGCALLAAAIAGWSPAGAHARQVDTFRLPNPLDVERSAVAYDGLTDGVYIAMNTLLVVYVHQGGKSINPFPRLTGVTALAFDDDRKLGFAAVYLGQGIKNNGQVVVFKLDAAFDKVKTLAVGNDPVAMVRDPGSGLIFTANAESSSISVIDPQTDSVKATISLKHNPGALAVDGQGRLFIGYTEVDSITAISTSTLQELKTWPITRGIDPPALAYDNRQNLWYIVRRNESLVILNPATDQTTPDSVELPIGNCATGCVYDAAVDSVYLASGTSGLVESVHAASVQSVSPIGVQQVEAGSRLIACDQEHDRLFVVECDECPGEKAEEKHPAHEQTKSGTFVLTELENLNTAGGK